jgi:hypothetical protein
MFRKNEGPVDRVIRLVGGAVLIALGFSVLDGLDRVATPSTEDR